MKTLHCCVVHADCSAHHLRPLNTSVIMLSLVVGEKLHADIVMMLEDILACICAETGGSMWTKLGRWMGIRKSEPVKFSLKSFQWPRRRGWKLLFFLRYVLVSCTTFPSMIFTKRDKNTWICVRVNRDEAEFWKCFVKGSLIPKISKHGTVLGTLLVRTLNHRDRPTSLNDRIWIYSILWRTGQEGAFSSWTFLASYGFDLLTPEIHRTTDLRTVAHARQPQPIDKADVSKSCFTVETENK